MPKPPHLKLPHDLRKIVAAQVLAERRRPAFLGEDPDDDLPEVEHAEEALFADHDAVRGHGRGTYVFDEDEAASRTRDAMEVVQQAHAVPSQEPIPMPPGEPAQDSVVLDLGA